jgi:hypothetical protein
MDAEQNGPGVPAFPGIARLELDELLVQLVERAQEVLGTQGRLRGLLAATQAIATDLSLPDMLRRIVEAARDLLDAKYVALGVLAREGGLAEFVHLGMSEDTVAEITAGHTAEGFSVCSSTIPNRCASRICPSIPLLTAFRQVIRRCAPFSGYRSGRAARFSATCI